MPERPVLAAVDLGSNSFHLLIARLEDGEPRIIDRVRETIRLGAGVDEAGRLDPEAAARALDCLGRFAQRLAPVRRGNVRAVGTHALRRLAQPGDFLRRAEAALGRPIEIISGREEARLVYAGVSAALPAGSGRRLVIDIGGGSSELIIGTDRRPELFESIQYGTVTVTQHHFRDGVLNRKRWLKARDELLADFQEYAGRFRERGWHTVYGASGAMRSIQAVLAAGGAGDAGLLETPALKQLRRAVLSAGDVSNLKLPGLSERRRPIFPAGLLILETLCEALGIEHVSVSTATLREGLLDDLIGRRRHRDPRHKTITSLAARYAIDRGQAQRVKTTALALFDGMAGTWQPEPQVRDWLAWAAEVHEAGLAIGHSRYQAHSGYLLRESDLPGFSRLDQNFMATLAAYHRRALPADWANALPERLHRSAVLALVCLRLAVILHRARQEAGPAATLFASENGVELILPPGWLETHPLTRHDLDNERRQLATLGLSLAVSEPQDPASHESLAARRAVP